MTDRRSLSRRKLLWAVATAGAAASTGSGTAAMFQNSERIEATLTVGSLDLLTSWGGDADGSSSSLQISSNQGSERIGISVSGNPSYVWFGTKCKECTAIEEKLFVRFGIDRGGSIKWLDGFDGTPDGYLSLREARDRLVGGILLGKFDPNSDADLVVEWTTEGTITDTYMATFEFRFHATQQRHIMDPSMVEPPWGCDRTCGPQTLSVPGISWVSFCGDPDFSTDFTPERSDDERTLLLDTSGYTVPNDVEKIAIKYGPYIDIFDYTGQRRVEVGTDDAVATFEHDGGSEYVNADTGETVDWDSKHFCNGLGGCKYEFPDRTAGGWKGCRSTSAGGGTGLTASDTSGNSSQSGGKNVSGNGPQNSKSDMEPAEASWRSFLLSPFGGDR